MQLCGFQNTVLLGIRYLVFMNSLIAGCVFRAARISLPWRPPPSGVCRAPAGPDIRLRGFSRCPPHQDPQLGPALHRHLLRQVSPPRSRPQKVPWVVVGGGEVCQLTHYLLLYSKGALWDGQGLRCQSGQVVRESHGEYRRGWEHVGEGEGGVPGCSPY